MPFKSAWKLIGVMLAILSGLVALPAIAQAPVTGARPLSVDQAFQLSATREDGENIRVEWKIADGYYLYKDGFALTRNGSNLPLTGLQGEAETKDDPTFGVTTVFHNRVAVVVPSAGGESGPTEVHYQGCQENGICYPPVVRQIDAATLAISASGKQASSPLVDAWSALQPVVPTSGIAIAENDDGMVGALLKDGGVLMVLGSFMLFGALLAFTPCVFPMYPILAATIAREGEAVTPLRGFSLSVAYVLAMATAFGLLGVFAAWSGQNLQLALQSPLAVGAVSILFLVLALSMFGAFELQLPSAWVNAISGVGRGERGSLASAGLLGFISALIVGPCVTAPLAGALIYIAQTGDVMLGAASLFALGFGKGIPLITFGTLGPKALPKAGAWMARVRLSFGFVFVAAAIWMLSRVLPSEAGLALWALFAIGLAVWLGAFDALMPESSGGRRAAKVAGLAAALYGIVLAVGAASGARDPFRPLERLVAQRDGAPTPTEALAFRGVANEDELQARVAAASDRPSLLYVTADWCVTCTVIERNVLSAPAVQAELGRFNLLKLDVSSNAPGQQEMMRRLHVVGPPTMIFISPEGREAAGTRLVGDVTRATLEAAAARARIAQ